MGKAKFTKIEREKFQKKLDEFLEDRLWKQRDFNGRTFYLKKESNYPPFNFLDKPSKKNLLSFQEIIQEINSFFLDNNYGLKVENNICLDQKIKDTFIMGAGIQYFRECFWNDKNLIKGKYFIPQPVIRMRTLNRIDEGITSSFVNISTVDLETSFKKHLYHLDNWFNLLSKLGLYMGDFNLEVIPKERYAKNKKGNWSKTDGFSLSINYLNLNVGDAGFIKIPTKKQELCVSDIGFGLERLLWSLYKTPSYFDIIGPKSETKYLRFKLVDSIRSATLLVMSNLSKNNIDSYNQFKKFIKIGSQHYGSFDTMKLIKHYHLFWSNFIKPQRSVFNCYSFLDQQLRDKNE
ncbi:MAG: hypothetical protein KKA65_03820 [Nanoarchaeota archaeon]|nr:hypothetical protein [Nanoarchaeota archaeon]MBU4456605.1 hypothetical protein [Nanoarchaeota archaeon]